MLWTNPRLPNGTSIPASAQLPTVVQCLSETECKSAEHQLISAKGCLEHFRDSSFFHPILTRRSVAPLECLFSKGLIEKELNSTEILAFLHFTFSYSGKKIKKNPLCDRYTDRYTLQTVAFCTPSTKCINTKAANLESSFVLALTTWRLHLQKKKYTSGRVDGTFEGSTACVLRFCEPMFPNNQSFSSIVPTDQSLISLLFPMIDH